MALIDSEAAFDTRCDKLAQGLKELMHVQSITMFSKLSFSVGTPQTAVSEVDMKNFADKIYTREATVGEMSLVKRLRFEANGSDGRPQGPGHCW
jgi:hypothetical protein